MSRVIVLQEKSNDGINLMRVDLVKLKKAFIDSVDFEVFIEGIEMKDSAVTLESITKTELKAAYRRSMKQEGYTVKEINRLLSKV